MIEMLALWCLSASQARKILNFGLLDHKNSTFKGEKTFFFPLKGGVATHSPPPSYATGKSEEKFILHSKKIY